MIPISDLMLRLWMEQALAAVWIAMLEFYWQHHGIPLPPYRRGR